MMQGYKTKNILETYFLTELQTLDFLKSKAKRSQEVKEILPQR